MFFCITNSYNASGNLSISTCSYILFSLNKDLRLQPQEELAGGSEHHVATFGPGELLKWPRRTAKVFGKPARVISGYLEILEEHGVSMPPTEVLETPEIVLPSGVIKVPYCMITTRIQGHHLRRPDLARPDVRQDLRAVITASKALESSGFSLDLFGVRTVPKILDPTRTLGNNLMVDERGLYLVDPSLRVLEEGSPREIVNMMIRTKVQHALGEVLLKLN